MRQLVFCLLVLTACSDPAEPGAANDVGGSPDTQSPDAVADTDAVDTDDDPDTAPDVPEVPRPEPGDPVDIDLGTFSGGDDRPRVFQATAEHLLTGEVTAAQPGDWVIENGAARFLIQSDRRAMGPCPFGGNVVDAALRTGDGFAADVTGETCLIVNVGRTLAPHRFDVVETPGGPVLAVTGELEILDFVAIEAQARDLLGGLSLDIPLMPDAPLPVTTTVYYHLVPGTARLEVVTAFRNDGTAPTHLAAGHVIDTGGDVSYFNPLSSRGGFGYVPVDEGQFRADPAPFLVFVGDDSSHSFVPRVDPRLSEGRELPVGGSYLTIVGAALFLHGLDDILPVLLAQPAALAAHPGLLHLDPGAVGQVQHAHVLGDGAASSIVDDLYSGWELPVSRVSGRLVDDGAEGLAGLHVSAVRGGRSYNHTRTGPDGRFSFVVPNGDYELRVRGSNVLATAAVVADGSELLAEFAPVVISGVRVHVTTPDGADTPAKVVALCDPGPCERTLTSVDADVHTDRFSDDAIAAVEYAGADGRVALALPEGDYRLVVSRGLNWSVWPAGAPTSTASVYADASWPEVRAEIARVVSPPGWITADLHVHGVRSLDSSIGHKARVLSYAAAGVDVLVMSDHDVVTDLGPTVEALGLGPELTTVAGEEVTTANYGHYNAFPMPYDPASPNGGALDWGGGGGYGASPADIFAALRSLPGERVVQVNHPEASGMITALRVDPLRRTTLTTPESLRLAPRAVDPETGDTGLWSDDFTAMELLNSPRMGRFWERFRWWLQMVGRGFVPTGTATTDTHWLRRVEAEAPYTWVKTPAEPFDAHEFAAALNRGAAVGTTGPFLDVEVVNDGGERAGPGQTLAATGEVTVRVGVQAAEWVDVDTLDVYVNVTEGIFGEPGEPISDAVPPTLSVPIEWADGDLVVVAEGVEEHRSRARVVEFALTISADTYVVVLARASSPEARTMFPVVGSRGQRAFAFSNPVLIDADGGGFDHPPLER